MISDWIYEFFAVHLVRNYAETKGKFPGPMIDSFQEIKKQKQIHIANWIEEVKIGRKGRDSEKTIAWGKSNTHVPHL